MPYVEYGRDLNGWDCFGCLRWVLMHHAGIELPMYELGTSADVARDIHRPPWIKVDQPRAFDLVSMEMPTPKGRKPLHIGVMVDDKRVLHASRIYGTVCIPLSHDSINHSVRNFYRHDSRYL